MRNPFIFAMLLAAGAPAFATTFIRGTVDAGTQATLGAVIDDGSSTGPASTTNAGTITSSSTAIVSGDYQVASAADVTATWASADAGTIGITWLFDIASAGSPLFTGVQTGTVRPNWSYTFKASGNGSFKGVYSIVATGDVFGLGPLYGGDDLAFGPYPNDYFDPNGSGNFTLALTNDQIYTVSLYNFGNVSSSSGFDQNATAVATIDWTISYAAVPEPATWSMMILGFALVGTITRRQVAATA